MRGNLLPPQFKFPQECNIFLAKRFQLIEDLLRRRSRRYSELLLSAEHVIRIELLYQVSKLPRTSQELHSVRNGKHQLPGVGFKPICNVVACDDLLWRHIQSEARPNHRDQ